MGPVVLFQALHSLLRVSPQPRFITISVSVACMGGPQVMLPIGSAAYGASKAALNYVTRKLHLENNWLSELMDLEHRLQSIVDDVC